MGTSRIVYAMFNGNMQAWIVDGTEYASLQDALNNAATGSVIKAQKYSFLEDVLFNRPGVTVTIDGGKDSFYDQTIGVTSIDKNYFKIRQGTVKVKGPLAVR
jgi:hypothetical protein